MTVFTSDPQLRHALAPLAQAAPHGYDSLDTLSDHLLGLMLTHPDAVKAVQPNKFFVELPLVDPDGYQVYDKTFTYQHSNMFDADLSVYPTLIEPAAAGFTALKVSDTSQFQPGNEVRLGDVFVSIQRIDAADQRVYLVEALLEALDTGYVLVPRYRKMRFGACFLDTAFMMQRTHSDHFYISYLTLNKVPRTVMVVVLDPTVTPETMTKDAMVALLSSPDIPLSISRLLFGAPYEPLTSFAGLNRLVNGIG